MVLGQAFIGIFVASALGLIFATSWNQLALTMLNTYQKKDPITGKILHPVRQMAAYAASVSVFCVFVLWFIYNFTEYKLK